MQFLDELFCVNRAASPTMQVPSPPTDIVRFDAARRIIGSFDSDKSFSASWIGRSQATAPVCYRGYGWLERLAAYLR